MFIAVLSYGNTSFAHDEKQITVTVSYEMLKGLPKDARCLQKIQNSFGNLIIKDYPWKRIVQTVKAGKADLTPCIFKNAEREKFLDLHGPIAVLPILLISSEANKVSLEDIHKRRGVFHLGTSLMKQYTNDNMVTQEVPNIDSIFGLIRTGRADYTILPGNFFFSRDTKGFSFVEVDYIPLYVGVSKKSTLRSFILSRLKERVPPLNIPKLNAATPRVTWAITHFPPFLIVNGPNAGNGISDKTVDFYISQTPNFIHKKQEATLQRVLHMMREGKHVCNGALLKNAEREEFIDYTDPYIAIFPNGVLTSKNGLVKMKPYLNKDQTINLEEMLRLGQVTLRYDAGRSYSPVIDNVLNRHKSTSTTLHRSTGVIDLKMDLKHVLSHKIDAVLGRAEEAYFAMGEQLRKKELFYLPVKGDAPYQFGYVGCAKGAWNDALIRELNRINRIHRSTEMFSSFYTRWLPPTVRDRYQLLARDVFGTPNSTQ